MAQLPPDGALLAFDEFALQSVPDTHYAWAERNTAPSVPSDGRHRERLNGFLAVDLRRGETRVQFRAEGRTDDVLFVLALTVLLCVQRGGRWIGLLMDNARTHRRDMQDALRELLAEAAALARWDALREATVEFLHTPPYSPAFNPAEYLIHWVRQDALYHLPCTFTLREKADRVQSRLAKGPPFTPEQMDRLLRHIYKLPCGKVPKWPKLE